MSWQQCSHTIGCSYVSFARVLDADHAKIQLTIHTDYSPVSGKGTAYLQPVSAPSGYDAAFELWHDTTLQESGSPVTAIFAHTVSGANYARCVVTTPGGSLDIWMSQADNFSCGSYPDDSAKMQKPQSLKAKTSHAPDKSAHSKATK